MIHYLSHHNHSCLCIGQMSDLARARSIISSSMLSNRSSNSAFWSSLASHLAAHLLTTWSAPSLTILLKDLRQFLSFLAPASSEGQLRMFSGPKHFSGICSTLSKCWKRFLALLRSASLMSYRLIWMMEGKRQMTNSLRKVQWQMGLPAASMVMILRLGRFSSLAICSSDMMQHSLNSRIFSFLNFLRVLRMFCSIRNSMKMYSKRIFSTVSWKLWLVSTTSQLLPQMNSMFSSSISAWPPVMQVVRRYSFLAPLLPYMVCTRATSSFHWVAISFSTSSWFSSSSESCSDSCIAEGALPSNCFRAGRYFMICRSSGALSLKQGLFSRVSSLRVCILESQHCSNCLISMRLLLRNSFSSLPSFCTFYMVVIRLDFRFTSLRLVSVSRFSILSIWLWERLRMRRVPSRPKPSIFWRRLECRSSTSSLPSSLMLRTRLIWFLDSSSTLRLVRVWMFSMSLIWLPCRSRYSRFGSDIRFSILVSLLCWKVSIFSFSSPSNKGTWFSSSPSRFSFSRLASRSTGRRQHTHTLGIWGSSAKMMLPPFSTRLNSPCLSRYRKRSSFSWRATSWKLWVSTAFLRASMDRGWVRRSWVSVALGVLAIFLRSPQKVEAYLSLPLDIQIKIHHYSHSFT